MTYRDHLPKLMIDELLIKPACIDKTLYFGIVQLVSSYSRRWHDKYATPTWISRERASFSPKLLDLLPSIAHLCNWVLADRFKRHCHAYNSLYSHIMGPCESGWLQDNHEWSPNSMIQAKHINVWSFILWQIFDWAHGKRLSLLQTSFHSTAVQREVRHSL